MAVAGRPEDEAVVMGGASLLLGLSVSDWPECFVASTSAAVVLCMSSGWGAPESKTWGIVHLRRGCLAAATLAVAADAAEGVLRCRSRQTVVKALWW